MKEKVKVEYHSCTGKTLESKKVNSGNLFKAINTWEVSLFRYSVIHWKKEEISEIDRINCKLFTMHKAHRP